MRKNIKIATTFLLFQFYPHLILTLAFCLISGCFVSFQNLAADQSAKVLEMYVNFVGIILLTPLFIAEQDKEIWRLEQTKKTPMWQNYLVRLVMSLIIGATIVTIFLYILKGSDSVVYMKDMWIGGVSEVFFLGSIGFFVSGITNQVVLGYMAAVMYYAINIGAHDKFGQLALFQMTRGEFDFAGWMSLVTVILLAAGIIIREWRSHLRG